MPQFKVKLVGCKRSERVDADYFKTDERGVLIFRRFPMIEGGYPVFVKCYANGTWLTIESVEARDAEG